MAQSEIDIKKLQGNIGKSGVPSTCPPGQEPWLTCPGQQEKRAKSVGERGISTTKSFHGPESLEIISTLSRIDSHEDGVHKHESESSIQTSLRGLFCIPARLV